MTQLEEWCRTNQLDTLDITKPLEPIKEATQLLQVNKKSLDDVDSILSVCATLNPLQVCELMFSESCYPDKSRFCQKSNRRFFKSHFGTARLLSLRSSVLYYCCVVISLVFVVVVGFFCFSYEINRRIVSVIHDRDQMTLCLSYH